MLGRNFRRAAPPATAKQPNAATCWWANALSAPPGYIRPTIYHAPRGPAAANGEADSRAEEDAAEDSGEEFVRSDIGKRHRREAERKPRDGEDAADGKRAPDETIAECDEGDINDGDQQWQ